MRTPLLAFEQLVCRFAGSRTSIGPLSGQVHPGQRIGLIGPNGAGKSTLLRLLSGYLQPAAGQIWVQGHSLDSLPPQARARLLAVVPQALGLQVALSARQVVGLGRLSHRGLFERLRLTEADGRHQAAVARAMRDTDTAGLADRLFDSLSGGEAQRVLLAMALAQDTPLLLLDEPTSHLDPGHAQQILQLLQGLAAEQGKGIIMVHHDLSTAGLYTDALWLMAKGVMLAQGPSEQVLASSELREAYGMSFLTVPHPGTGRSMLFPG